MDFFQTKPHCTCTALQLDAVEPQSVSQTQPKHLIHKISHKNHCDFFSQFQFVVSSHLVQSIWNTFKTMKIRKEKKKIIGLFQVLPIGVSFSFVQAMIITWMMTHIKDGFDLKCTSFNKVQARNCIYLSVYLPVSFFLFLFQYKERSLNALFDFKWNISCAMCVSCCFVIFFLVKRRTDVFRWCCNLFILNKPQNYLQNSKQHSKSAPYRILYLWPNNMLSIFLFFLFRLLIENVRQVRMFSNNTILNTSAESAVPVDKESISVLVCRLKQEHFCVRNAFVVFLELTPSSSFTSMRTEILRKHCLSYRNIRKPMAFEEIFEL